MPDTQEDRPGVARSPATSQSSSDMIRRTLAQGQKLRVCIVGAGVAGLRAADVLLQHGAHITIYEGRDRVGGRVSSPQHHLLDGTDTYSSDKATT